MALIIQANYSKKIGLPGYSSHQYSLNLTVEVSEVSQVSAKSQELHALMQACVDRELQTTGFLPGESNGSHTNGNGNGQHKPGPDKWVCSDKQRELILKITDENKLDKTKVDQLAQDRFGKGVKQLNKLEASGLIEELLEETGQTKPRNQRFQRGGVK